MQAQRVRVSGVVQGVGFRPFVYGLAQRHALHGWVCNTSGGVDILVEGEPSSLQAFVRALSAEAPPLARIDTVETRPAAPDGYSSFEIRASQAEPGLVQPISPDVAVCPDCQRELFDPADRRYLYPFINCTNCGPRFTIIRGLPYDRPQTTLAGFRLCPECAREYGDPLDRRFHAQPVACPTCGPGLWLAGGAGAPLAQATSRGTEALLLARQMLREGKILAVRGLGGFHLACDAANPDAVRVLRERKGRVDKPFALMAASLQHAARLAEISPAEQALLEGREKPIVLLPRRPQAPADPDVAPGLDRLGVMLPYTPLHHLLLDQADPILARSPVPPALVMTSGNYSEEPIATDNAEALARLTPLADAFLLHDRDIHQRCDDSVVRLDQAPTTDAAPPLITFLRRSRGYAPYPVRLPFDVPPLLAVGGELKNTFCLAREHYAFLSQHIGDMQNAETLASFEHSLDLLQDLFQVEPVLIAHDLHPDYLTTRLALRLASSLQPPVSSLAIQHHHAHVAACLADNGLPAGEPVIGLSFDGTGYGTDGCIWGGEVLLADYAEFTRLFHLEYLPLPGGDAATRHPWRTAVGYARALGLEVDDLPALARIDARQREVVRRQVERRVNTPLTSSMGRLFDAVAVLAGGRASVSYEAQAAIELETAARQAPGEMGDYPFTIEAGQIGLRPLLAAVIADARRGQPLAVIGRRFHRTLADLALEVCRAARAAHGLRRVALSGGVWQNALLLELAQARLRAAGFEVITHHQTPANDGGLALGQAVVAAHRIGR